MLRQGNTLVDEGQAAGDAGGGAALRNLGAAHGARHAKLADVEVGAVAVAAVQHGPDHGLACQRLVAAHLGALEAVGVRAHAAALAVHVLRTTQSLSKPMHILQPFLPLAPLFAQQPIIPCAHSLPVMPLTFFKGFWGLCCQRKRSVVERWQTWPLCMSVERAAETGV